MSWLGVVLSLALSLLAFGQNSQGTDCVSHQTCTDCIRNPHCAWCIKPNGINPEHCGPRSAPSKGGQDDSWCDRKELIDYTTNHWIDEKNNKEFSAEKNEPVQIRPQRMTLRIRKGEEHRIRVEYKRAKGFPVDLYYLMDLSFSMKIYRNQLSQLGEKLAEEMKKLTSDFRIGFGSFIDKVVMPMTSTDPEKLANPCIDPTDLNKTCTRPYPYRNHMELMDDTEEFKKQVGSAPLSANLDAPEGGLEAMMQAMVCTNEIGWRDNARKLLVVSTDESFHIAGDGRLAGIVEPNDGLCHLDKNGSYTHDLIHDYPSISQIRNTAKNRNIFTIFAVTEKVKKGYDSLAMEMERASVGALDPNETSKVINLIYGEYEKLAGSVAMTDNKMSFIDVKYFSRCKGGEITERNECKDLRFETVEFDVVIKVTECPEDPKEWRQTLKIGPKGLSERLIVDLELICDCACNRKNDSAANASSSENCSKHGNLLCGICACDEGFNGKQCEFKDGEDACRSGPDKEICNGHGSCKYGVCKCEPRSRFNGKYCQCDNLSCPWGDGKVCSGQGTCDCSGKCNCNAGWSGPACQYSNATCIVSKELDEICGGHGKCVDGKCECNSINDVKYYGPYCQEFSTSKDCTKLEGCVECRKSEGGEDKSCSKCDGSEEVEVVEDGEWNNGEWNETLGGNCTAIDADGCIFTFRYKYMKVRGDTNNATRVKVAVRTKDKEKDCGKPANVLAVASGVVISTLILGLLALLIWKVLTTIHDKREWAKFENERANAKWDRGENPLYKQAVSTFNNPTFNDDSGAQSNVKH